ncbi:hypothetical protein Acr_15g0010190 [Actinidia rufa]|uniref:Uncharacterized protein n=1 Tax=Actinidia rufa TaxID=165716 RepID=A0A7J0FUQ6_9ERIC|nr:hypothetical protein Acr_15g0010190 [Actinidia rufa]
MHLRNRLLPRPSTNSLVPNQAHTMADNSQAPNIEGLHREMHGIAEQIRIMNENNACLIQHLATNNPPSPATPIPLEIEWSHCSRRSGNYESQNRQSTASETSRWTCEVRDEMIRIRGRSPRREDREPICRGRSTTQKIRNLDARIDAINTGANAYVTVDALVRQAEPPFTDRIMKTSVSSKFKPPSQLGTYDGKIDPIDHLDSSPKRREKFERLRKEIQPGCVRGGGVSEKVVLMAMMEGLCPGLLFDSLSKNVLKTQSVLQNKVDKYISAEEPAKTKRRRSNRDVKRKTNDRRLRTPPHLPNLVLPPLNTTIAQVLTEIKHEEFVKWPRKIKTDPHCVLKVNIHCESVMVASKKKTPSED